jgi:hypothetical protein
MELINTSLGHLEIGPIGICLGFVIWDLEFNLLGH